VSEKIAWSIGSLNDQFGSSGFNQIAGQVLPITYGMNPVLMGAMLGFIRIYDALTDLLMGRISDNHRGRWGRRKPFIVVGAISAGLIFPLCWIPDPTWSETMKYGYFTAFAVLYYTAYTVFSVPWRAMGFELTPDYAERTRLYAVMSIMTKFSSMAFPWFLPLTYYGWFGDPVQSTRILAGATAVLLISFGLVPAVFCRPRVQPSAKSAKPVRILAGFADFAREPAFWSLKGIALTMLMATTFVNIYDNFIGMFYVWGGNLARGGTIGALAGNFTFGLGLVTVLVIQRWFSHLDKRVVITWTTALALVGALSKWFFWNPDLPYLSLFAGLLQGPAIGGFWLIYSAMGPDYADYDEYRHGQRREGLYGAIHGWFAKAATSLTLVLIGVALESSGFVVERGSAQAEGVFFTMRLVSVLGSALLMIGTLFCIRAYPLTRERMAGIRAELDRRARADA
jgi:GPH family glycoside/pentoside/hexuronide:cation symporter